jgi:peptidoglycan/LPS O-acetylase OafA/YrhL
MNSNSVLRRKFVVWLILAIPMIVLAFLALDLQGLTPEAKATEILFFVGVIVLATLISLNLIWLSFQLKDGHSNLVRAMLPLAILGIAISLYSGLWQYVTSTYTSVITFFLCSALLVSAVNIILYLRRKNSSGKTKGMTARP